MATAAGSPEKQSYTLLTIRHGDKDAPSFERYTDWGRDVENFVSTPSMGIELPDNEATFEASECKILMPLDDFTFVVASGLPHSPMFVQIEEVTAGLNIGDAGSRKTLFRGRVTRTIKNFQGQNNIVAFFALPAKARINVAMGLQCNHHCSHRVFSRGCGLNINLHALTGQIDAMDGKVVTVSTATIIAPSAPGGDNSRFWERGYLERDGLMIGIHIWKLSDPTTFVLRRRPPNSWLLAGTGSIKFVPGCHKTIEDCRDVWDNEQGQSGSGGFLALGYAMLPYNPMFQNPQ